AAGERADRAALRIGQQDDRGAARRIVDDLFGEQRLYRIDLGRIADAQSEDLGLGIERRALLPDRNRDAAPLAIRGARLIVEAVAADQRGVERERGGVRMTGPPILPGGE